MCCAVFYVEWGCSVFRLWRQLTTGWFALGCGNFGSQTPKAALSARLVRPSFLTLMLSLPTPSKATAASSTAFAPGVRGIFYTLVFL